MDESEQSIEFPTINFWDDGKPEDHIPYMTLYPLAETLSKLKNPREVVWPHRHIHIRFDKPISRPFNKSFSTSNETGFTREQIAGIIITEYQKIYTIEDTTAIQYKIASLDPPCPSTHTTDGIYGIRGIPLRDISLRSITKRGDKKLWNIMIE